MPDSERRGGVERRIDALEDNYSTIIRRLNTLDASVADINTLKSQIQGMINLIKFVGWGGIIAIIAFVVRDFAKH